MPRLFRLMFFVALLGSASAEAKEMTFADLYIVDVPAGWTVNRIADNYVMLVSPNAQAVFLITHGQSMNKHREMVADMVKRYDALRLGSPDRLVSLTRLRYQRVTVTIVGDHPDRVPLYRSIKAVPGDKMREQWGTR